MGVPLLEILRALQVKAEISSLSLKYMIVQKRDVDGIIALGKLIEK